MTDISSRKSPPLTVLFWFYKELDICRNRLEHFRETNPDTVIFGLYGGPAEDADLFAKTLHPYLGDFYLSPYLNSDWKWRHGDLMINDWYRQRGRQLDWQSIFILQWDALICTNLDQYFSARQPDELFFTGYQRLTAVNEHDWFWTGPDHSTNQQDWFAFQDKVRRETDHALTSETWHDCVFVFEILTKSFLEQYSKISDPEVGFLEYKIPTYVHLWGFPVYCRDLGQLNTRTAVPFHHRPINAIGLELHPDYINQELAKPEGWRLFHPYFKEWEIGSGR